MADHASLWVLAVKLGDQRTGDRSVPCRATAGRVMIGVLGPRHVTASRVARSRAAPECRSVRVAAASLEWATVLRRVRPASAAAPAGQTWEVEVGVMQASPVAADIVVVAAEAEVVAASAVVVAVVAE